MIPYHFFGVPYFQTSQARAHGLSFFTFQNPKT